MIKKGIIYDDGWKVHFTNMNEAVLTKGKSNIHIIFERSFIAKYSRSGFELVLTEQEMKMCTDIIKKQKEELITESCKASSEKLYF